MKWFGKAWNPRSCKAEDHIPTPVGEECADFRCKKKIEADDDGVQQPLMFSDPPKLLSWHLNCFLRSIGLNPDGSLWQCNEADCPECNPSGATPEWL